MTRSTPAFARSTVQMPAWAIELCQQRATSRNSMLRRLAAEPETAMRRLAMFNRLFAFSDMEQGYGDYVPPRGYRSLSDVALAEFADILRELLSVRGMDLTNPVVIRAKGPGVEVHGQGLSQSLAVEALFYDLPELSHAFHSLHQMLYFTQLHREYDVFMDHYNMAYASGGPDAASEIHRRYEAASHPALELLISDQQNTLLFGGKTISARLNALSSILSAAVAPKMKTVDRYFTTFMEKSLPHTQV